MIKVYFDGACEPNPNGYMGIGCWVLDTKTKNIIYEHSACYNVGENGYKYTSCNVAEYEALRNALTWLLANNHQESDILCIGDSNLVINQMSGVWKIKSGLYALSAFDTRKLVKEFSTISFEWIPRGLNEYADELSKRAMIERDVEFKIQPNLDK